MARNGSLQCWRGNLAVNATFLQSAAFTDGCTLFSAKVSLAMTIFLRVRRG